MNEAASNTRPAAINAWSRGRPIENTELCQVAWTSREDTRLQTLTLVSIGINPSRCGFSQRIEQRRSWRVYLGDGNLDDAHRPAPGCHSLWTLGGGYSQFRRVDACAEARLRSEE